LIEPAGIDVDPAGRIWVVDTGHDGFAIFSRDGGFLERWGERGNAPGRFSFRRALGNVGDIRFAPDGGFYVADNGNHRIQRFDPDRRLVACWGVPGREAGQFLDPWSVRLDGDEVFVSDAIRDDIQVFSTSGRHRRTIGRPGSGPGQLDFQGDAIMAGDRLHVADHANGRISVFDRDGGFVRALGAGLLRGPDGLDVGPGGDLYVADTLGRRFTILDADGAVRASWPGQAWTLRVLPDGRVLTAGRASVTIQRVTPIEIRYAG
jgi:DNA-binding beta-propeller fold protein YncE